MDEVELEKQMKAVIKANIKFQDLDSKFTNNVNEYFKLTSDQSDYLFTTYDDIVDSLQYSTGSISWNTFKKHVIETKEKK